MTFDPALRFLTDEQLLASATELFGVFLESAPGSGKTTVAAQRFGVKRYERSRLADGRYDDRGVLAVSFTRSATRELATRVRRSWGPTAIRRPHRIQTLDTLVWELVTDLLKVGLLEWPGGHKVLDVHDSWKVLVRYAPMTREYGVSAKDGKVFVGSRLSDERKMRPEPNPMIECVKAGQCTHDDVRRVLSASLGAISDVVDRVVERLAATTRCLIVDEVYDANTLDLALIELAARAGVQITVIGDPWQALYGFRGARPDAVPGLIERTGMVTMPLSRSFRWQTERQAALAEDLRSGRGIELTKIPGGGDRGLEADVVLACLWDDLWSTGSGVLPLAFGSAKGNYVEAATTLLLNRVIQSGYGLHATYLSDALATLGITDQNLPIQIEVEMDRIIATLAAASDKLGLAHTYKSLIDLVSRYSARRSRRPIGDIPNLVSRYSARPFPSTHWRYTQRLGMLRERLVTRHRCTIGMTVHQAKGREWDTVGIRLSDAERGRLAAGLNRAQESDRQLYVACTRARYRTVEVTV